MAVTLDATPGGATANSYVTLEAAQAYLSDERIDDPPAGWADATDEKRKKALITATAYLNTLPFPGRSYYAGTTPSGQRRQPLFFPRTVDGLVIPKAVQEATVEFALYLIDRPAEDTQRQALQAQGVASFGVRGASEQFRRGSGRLIDYCPAAGEKLRLVGFGSVV